MIVWDKRELFCAVLCTTVVDSYTHMNEQFSKLSVGLGLAFAFVCLFRFGLLYVFGLA